MQLSGFKALSFDCYGTLIDWESGMAEGLQPLLSRAAKQCSRDEMLAAHARYESRQQAQTPGMLYRDVLAAVYKRLAEEWGVDASFDECATYGNSVARWPAFADSADALRYLKSHYKLIILSNVDNESFAHSRKKLGVEFDAVCTAEDIGAYKPSMRNFEYMLEKLRALGVEKHEILHTAESMFHDHAPANRCGLKSCRIHRRHAQKGFGAAMHPGEMPHYDFCFNGMAEFVEAHRAEAAA